MTNAAWVKGKNNLTTASNSKRTEQLKDGARVRKVTRFFYCCMA